MATHDFDWFLKNPDAYERLTAEQVHTLGNGGTVDSDENATPATESAAETKPVEQPAAAAATEPPKVTEPAKSGSDDEPVILTKDGKHAIPYSELQDARDKAVQLEVQLKEQKAVIDQLTAAKKADETVGGTENQEEFLKDLKAQFPELYTAIAPDIQKAIKAGVDVQLAEIKKDLNSAIAPLQQSFEDASQDAHFAAIRKGIPDFEAIRDSGEFSKWVDELPSYARTAAKRVTEEGEAREVVELLTEFKKSQVKPAEPQMTAAEAKAKADQVISEAKTKGVKSLTDVPSSQTVIPEEPTTVAGWSAKFSNMSPADILKSL